MSSALALLLTLAAVEPTGARQAAVIDGRPVPLLGTDGSRTAVGHAIEPSGWQAGALGGSACSTDDCFKEAAARAGVARLFFIDVAPVAGAKFRYDVSLRVWDVEGGIDRRGSRTCEPCLLRRDFEQTIGMLAATLAAEVDVELARARPAAAVGAAVVGEPAVAALPMPVAALEAPRQEESGSLVGPLLLGAGAVALGGGVLLTYLDGRKIDCNPACARAYDTHGGVALIVGGAAAAIAGTLLWAPWRRSQRKVALVVAPWGACLGGAF